jgi:hypothetical protein
MWDDSEMTEKTGYKFSAKFNQSLTSGTIAFEGYFGFDSFEEYLLNKDVLLRILKEQEEIFTKEGYKVASIIPNNLKLLGNDKKK